VNRWRVRLAELQSDAFAPPAHVQNVQNVQKPPTSEHFEQIEQWPEASTTQDGTNEERAAIIEHDRGAPRSWSEGLARLDPNKPPGDIPPRRWLRFIDDCGHFLDTGWAERAATLGWGPLDLFGCDRERPFARVDHLGLLWLRNGCSILELRRDRAILKTESGALQTFYRRPVEVGRVVLVWELGPS
jgi:hypothetical protein